MEIPDSNDVEAGNMGGVKISVQGKNKPEAVLEHRHRENQPEAIINDCLEITGLVHQLSHQIKFLPNEKK